MYISWNNYHNKLAFITSHSSIFFFLMRTFKICCLSNFEIYSMVLLTVVTMVYIISPEIIHLITRSLFPLTTITHFPHPKTTIKLLCISDVSFFSSTSKRDHRVFKTATLVLFISQLERRWKRVRKQLCICLRCTTQTLHYPK